MSPPDLPEIARLEVLAFTDYYRHTGRRLPPPERTQQHLLASLSLNPAGCVVATAVNADRPVGFAFARRWGAIGWIGTIGVAPEMRGLHIGSALVAAAVDGLERDGCTTIGLETMPDSPGNIGFYVCLGFRPTGPTLALSKAPEPARPAAAYCTLSEVGGAPALGAVSRVSRETWAHIDYAPEARNASEYGWGDTLLWGWPDAWAVATVRTAPKKHGASDHPCHVDSLAIVPGARHRFCDVLRAVDAFAHAQHAPEVTVAINAGEAEALRQALAYGFRVRGATLRMVLRHDGSVPAGIDISAWAM